MLIPIKVAESIGLTGELTGKYLNVTRNFEMLRETSNLDVSKKRLLEFIYENDLKSLLGWFCGNF